MEVVKESNEEQIGLKAEDMRVGNKFVDRNGKVVSWDLDDYVIQNESEVSGVDIDFKTAKALGFKFREVSEHVWGVTNESVNLPKGIKTKTRTGFLYIQPNHYYMWRPEQPLRLSINAGLFVDSDFAKEVLHSLKEKGVTDEMLEDVYDNLGAQHGKTESKIMTKITQVHELQNHAFYLYAGHEIDVSKIK